MKGKKILVVEDETKIADIVKAYLEKDGFTVVTAQTGEKAMSQLKEGFNLIILDLMLPDMDGEDICSAIRKDSDVPIIMLTAKGRAVEREKGLALGADAYISKPFSTREVVEKVRSILEEKPTT